MDSFINRLTVEEHKETFSDTILKNRLKTFQDGFVKAKVSKNGKQHGIQVQSDILENWSHFLV